MNAGQLKLRGFCLLGVLWLGSATAKDEIIFSTAPTQTPEETRSYIHRWSIT